MTKTFSLAIDLGNAAFEDDPAFEIARILTELSRRVVDGGLPKHNHHVPIHDVNGNQVGSFQMKGATRKIAP
jgi:hypothetical protein